MRKISHSRRRQFSRPLRLERLEERTVLTAGMLDPSFGTGGKVLTDFGFNEDAPTWDQAQAVQADGKIVVVGGSEGHFAVARLNADGSLDTTFDGDGKRTIDFGPSGSHAYGVALQADGKIVLAGYSYQGSTGYDFAVARLNADGSLDTTFDGDGKQLVDFGSYNDFAFGVALQADGKIVVAGQSYQGSTGYDCAVARLNTDGSLDTTFDSDAKQTVDFGSYEYATAIAVQADGKIVVAGHTNGYGFLVARLNSDGSLDTTFDFDGKQTVSFGGYGYANAVALQADGRIVVAGYSYGTGRDFAIARLWCAC